MRFRRVKENPNFYIAIEEERYYFPGENIKGKLHVKLSKPTKSSAIRITFTGEVILNVKEKQNFRLFHEELEVLRQAEEASANGSDGSSTVTLDGKDHEFSFEFAVPDDPHLPSHCELFKDAKVLYIMRAILERPFVPDTMSSRAELNIPVLQRIDVDDVRYSRGLIGYKDFPWADQDVRDPRNFKRGVIKVSIPKSGYVRGQPIPVNISTHLLPPIEPRTSKGLLISLHRVAIFRTRANTSHTTRLSIKDVQVNPQTILSSPTITEQLLIPTHTPPSIEAELHSFRMMSVRYEIVIRLDLDSPERKRTHNPLKKAAGTHNKYLAEIIIPVTVGTYPFATLLIDDDDDNWTEEMSTLSLTTTGDEPLDGNHGSDASLVPHPFPTTSSGQPNSRQRPHIEGRKSGSNNTSAQSSIMRSDSQVSISSQSSEKSRKSWNSNGSLGRQTSTSTTRSAPVVAQAGRGSVYSETGVLRLSSNVLPQYADLVTNGSRSSSAPAGSPNPNPVKPTMQAQFNNNNPATPNFVLEPTERSNMGGSYFTGSNPDRYSHARTSSSLSSKSIQHTSPTLDNLNMWDRVVHTESVVISDHEQGSGRDSIASTISAQHSGQLPVSTGVLMSHGDRNSIVLEPIDTATLAQAGFLSFGDDKEASSHDHAHFQSRDSVPLENNSFGSEDDEDSDADDPLIILARKTRERSRQQHPT
ncbi:hypothetical protein BZG36_01148 [Bifiguratus adelaidae]|uniref:Arrestin C-terminal-like domain-containing protein n=1 Tax=Bifiguratus adelaidae TaxID=1938954 RepID=A0A261Y5Y7_9FUNG|nr:hypothetical protein BZG36_01148 [Bifiguratus adelaidae]